MGDCPKCGFANPGAVDFCPNPECRTYLGWASIPAAATPPRMVSQAPPVDTKPMAVPVPTYPSAGTPAAPPASPPQKRGVRVTVDQAELTVDPGGVVDATVTVRNLGTRVEEFQLTPGGPAAPFTSLSPTTLSVYPEDEQRAVARFAPVRGPQSPAGVAPFEIVARSAIQSDVSDVARGRVTVTPFTDLKAVLRPEVSRGRRPGRHLVSVTNGGNTPVTAELAFRDQDSELTFQPPSGTATLPPGATMNYSVRINGKHRWFGRTERHPFSAVLTPAGPQPPITLNGTRRQTAVFPWWIPPAAFAIIALAIAVYLAWPGPTVPQVADFTQSVAETTLRDAGYVVSGATAIADPKRAGLVVKTDPAAGSPLEKGQRVQVFVSTGPCQPVCKVTVPPTKGRTEADARTILGAAGFTVGQVVQSPSDLPLGSVKETSPAEQTEAPTNVPVVLFVSSGARLTPEQLASYQGQSAAAVKQALGSGVKVTEVSERTNEFAKGKVVRVVQDASDPRRVTMFVAAPTATDLVAMASRASWRSSAGTLTFPGRVTDAKGAVLISTVRLPDGTTGRVLGTIPPNTGARSIIGAFQLATNQTIIPGDRLKGNVGLLAAGATGPATFAVKIGSQIPVSVTVEPGQLMPIDQPLDAFHGAATIEIGVTGNPAATQATPGDMVANQAVWQNLRIEGTIKNP